MRKTIRYTFILALVLIVGIVSGCSASGTSHPIQGAASPNSNSGPNTSGSSGGTTSPIVFTIGGAVNNLSGTLVLQNNGGDDLTITKNGSFAFKTTLTNTTAYLVTTKIQPSGQTCTISNGNGSVDGADITDVAINCVAANTLSNSPTASTVSPTISITNAPPKLTNSTNATFVFSSSGSGVSFECQVDKQAAAACLSPFSIDNLLDGAHAVIISGKDVTGNISASYSWDIDTSKPIVAISNASSKLTNSTSATFEFSATKSTTFTCQLDGAPTAPCNSPISFNNLSSGPHSFAVVATDTEGNISLPANYSWAIDLTPPTVISVSPLANATAVSVNTTVGVVFSKAVATSTDAINLSCGSHSIGWTVSSDGNGTLTFTPSIYISDLVGFAPSPLPPSTICTGTINSKYLKDLAGNTLAGDYTWTFTTDGCFQPSGSSNGVCNEYATISSTGVSDEQLLASIAIDGDYAMFGFLGAGSPQTRTGSVIIFHRTIDGSWSRVQKIKAVDIVSGQLVSDDYTADFGQSLSISGDYAIVGSYYETIQHPGQGAAYIFQKSLSGSWTKVQKLIAPDATDGDGLGSTVAISGNYAIVGALGKNTAYIYYRDPSGAWGLAQELLGAGSAVSIDSNNAIVGGNGSIANIYNRSGTATWTPAKTINSSNFLFAPFIPSVSISNGNAIIAGNGSAYIYHQTTNDWIQTATLSTTDSAGATTFGATVSISGDKAVVGALGKQDYFSPIFGAAYVFQLQADGTWPQIRKLVPIQNSTSFGSMVNISGSDIIIASDYSGLASYLFK